MICRPPYTMSPYVRVSGSNHDSSSHNSRRRVPSHLPAAINCSNTRHKQASVQLRTYALTTWHCPHLLLRPHAAAAPAVHAAIDRCLLLTGPAAANPPHTAAAGEWDRQTETDGHRIVTIDPAREVSIPGTKGRTHNRRSSYRCS